MKACTWYSALEKLKAKLARWKSKHVSFGGRVCLIKSVLSSLALVLLDLFQSPF